MFNYNAPKPKPQSRVRSFRVRAASVRFFPLLKPKGGLGLWGFGVRGPLGFWGFWAGGASFGGASAPADSTHCGGAPLGFGLWPIEGVPLACPSVRPWGSATLIKKIKLRFVFLFLKGVFYFEHFTKTSINHGHLQNFACLN